MFIILFKLIRESHPAGFASEGQERKEELLLVSDLGGKSHHAGTTPEGQTESMLSKHHCSHSWTKYTYPQETDCVQLGRRIKLYPFS